MITGAGLPTRLMHLQKSCMKSKLQHEIGKGKVIAHRRIEMMAPVSAWYRKYGACGARSPASGCTSSEIARLCCSNTSRALRTAAGGSLLWQCLLATQRQHVANSLHQRQRQYLTIPCMQIHKQIHRSWQVLADSGVQSRLKDRGEWQATSTSTVSPKNSLIKMAHRRLL